MKSYLACDHSCASQKYGCYYSIILMNFNFSFKLGPKVAHYNHILGNAAFPPGQERKSMGRCYIFYRYYMGMLPLLTYKLHNVTCGKLVFCEVTVSWCCFVQELTAFIHEYVPVECECNAVAFGALWLKHEVSRVWSHAGQCAGEYTVFQALCICGISTEIINWWGKDIVSMLQLCIVLTVVETFI